MIQFQSLYLINELFIFYFSDTVASSTKTDEPDSCQTAASSSQDDDQVDQEDLDQDDAQDDDDDGSVDLEEYQYSGDDYDYRGHGIVTGIKGSHWKRDKVKNKRKKEKPEPEAPPTDNIKKNMESMFRTSLDLAEDEGYLQACEAIVTSLYPHQMRALYWMAQVWPLTQFFSGSFFVKNH